MNIFNGKGVAIKDGQFGPWTPGLAAGFVVRTGDKFVSGAPGRVEDLHQRGRVRGRQRRRGCIRRCRSW